MLRKFFTRQSVFSLSLSQGRPRWPLSISQGFTLLELLVVVAIIGMMTAVVAVNSNAARIQSRDAKRKTDATLVAGALQIFYSEQRSYPVAQTASWTGLKDWTGIPTGSLPKFFPTYVSQWPSDPINATADGTAIGNKNGFSYQTNQAAVPALNNVPAASLFIVDVTLEGKETASLSGTDVDCVNADVPTFYVTGIFLCPDGKFHDRISSR